MIRVILVDEDAADVRVAGTFADASGAVRFLARRMRAVSPKAAILILSEDERAEAVRPAGDPLQRLSAREMEVLKLVVEGNTSAAVAARLGLSPKSIDTYRSRLMTKLEVRHLAGLVKFAIRRGLTSP